MPNRFLSAMFVQLPLDRATYNHAHFVCLPFPSLTTDVVEAVANRSLDLVIRITSVKLPTFFSCTPNTANAEGSVGGSPFDEDATTS